MSVDLPTPSAVPPGPESSDSTPCGSCALNNAANLKRLGVDIEGCDVVVALAGNPNTGKSTVFNALTGLRQHVGNWPGTTVSRAEGACSIDGATYKVVDLPGTYSLLSNSRDEDVARDFLLFGDPDVTVVVVDATRLERNLNLVLQILQVTGRVVVALNLMDEARRHGLEVNARRLARELGVPVVPTAARNGEGVSDLMQVVGEVASGGRVNKPRRVRIADETFERAVSELAAEVEALAPGLPNARWVALRLLDGDERITQAVRTGELAELVERQGHAGLPVMEAATA